LLNIGVVLSAQKVSLSTLRHLGRIEVLLPWSTATSSGHCAPREASSFTSLMMQTDPEELLIGSHPLALSQHLASKYLLPLILPLS
jgi:hypothetical protein